MLIGHKYEWTSFRLLEIKDQLRNLSPFLFSPMPAIVGASIAEVGTQGDRIWRQIKSLLRERQQIQYRVRKRMVLYRRYCK
jgi:hypothetical protein